MDENTKKGALIVVAVLAVVAAGYSAFHYATADKMQIENTVAMPPGHKSEKQLALEAQAAGSPTTASKGEKDLGGNIGGN